MASLPFALTAAHITSKQILYKNLELAEKEIALALNLELELADHLIADALENAVSSLMDLAVKRAKHMLPFLPIQTKPKRCHFRTYLGHARKFKNFSVLIWHWE